MVNRRIEITAFCHRVLIRCADKFDTAMTTDRFTITDTASLDPIDSSSAEGRKIVEEVIKLLQERLRR